VNKRCEEQNVLSQCSLTLTVCCRTLIVNQLLFSASKHFFVVLISLKLCLSSEIGLLFVNFFVYYPKNWKFPWMRRRMLHKNVQH
jgi:DNA polymerase sigma